MPCGAPNGGPQKSGAGKVIALVAGAFIALAAIGGGSYFLLSGNEEETTAQSSESSSSEAASTDSSTFTATPSSTASTSSAEATTTAPAESGGPTTFLIQSDSITDSKGRLNPCSADKQIQASWRVQGLEDMEKKNDNVRYICGGKSKSVTVILAALEGPPLAYNRGESQPSMGGEWRVFKTDDGWYDIVHKLKDGYFSLSAKTTDLEDVALTMKGLEYSLFGGGFADDFVEGEAE